MWCLPSEADDHKLVDVPVGTRAYRRVQNLFNETIPETQVDIISIQQVQNLLHWDKYQRYQSSFENLKPANVCVLLCELSIYQSFQGAY